jgi:glycerol-3-phosphate dehydrogenase
LISQPGRRPSEISRRDEVWTGPGGILSIAGGKLTAYRKMVERVADTVFERLGQPATPAVSQDRPLIGGDFESAPIDEAAKAGQQPRDRLTDLYGSEASDVQADGGDLAAEVRQAVRREGALRLEDYWVRRAARAFFDLDAGLSTLEPASQEMARLLDWNEETRAAEVAACRHRHEKNNALFNQARRSPRQ